MLQSAYVNGLQDSALFKAMFVEDVDAHKIELLPGVSLKLKQCVEGGVIELDGGGEGE